MSDTSKITPNTASQDPDVTPLENALSALYTAVDEALPALAKGNPKLRYVKPSILIAQYMRTRLKGYYACRQALAAADDIIPPECFTDAARATIGDVIEMIWEEDSSARTAAAKEGCAFLIPEIKEWCRVNGNMSLYREATVTTANPSGDALIDARTQEYQYIWDMVNKPRNDTRWGTGANEPLPTYTPLRTVRGLANVARALYAELVEYHDKHLKFPFFKPAVYDMVDGTVVALEAARRRLGDGDLQGRLAEPGEPGWLDYSRDTPGWSAKYLEITPEDIIKQAPGWRVAMARDITRTGRAYIYYKDTLRRTEYLLRAHIRPVSADHTHPTSTIDKCNEDAIMRAARERLPDPNRPSRLAGLPKYTVTGDLKNVADKKDEGVE